MPELPIQKTNALAAAAGGRQRIGGFYRANGEALLQSERP
jgi:hypothetical protein